jgi:hypothetical protein
MTWTVRMDNTPPQKPVKSELSCSNHRLVFLCSTLQFVCAPVNLSLSTPDRESAHVPSQQQPRQLLLIGPMARVGDMSNLLDENRASQQRITWGECRHEREQ